MSSKIGELKGIAELWKNPHILIRRYLKEEAVVSSKIEGTLASIQDVFQYEVTGNMNKDESQHLETITRSYQKLNDIYVHLRILRFCLKNIRYDNKRITLEMIKKAHQILMHDVRGGDKRPGEIRTSLIQNWIVPYGLKL